MSAADRARALHAKAVRLRAEAEQVTAERNEAMREWRSEGESMYRIAKELGIRPQAVAKAIGQD